MSDARTEAAAKAGWEWECARLDDSGVWEEMDPTLRQNLLDVCGVMLAAADEVERGLADQLAAALQATRDELNHWGKGDMHYGNTPQEPRVVKAVAVADEALSAYAALGSSVRTQESASDG